ncbi:hypothetical protein LPJ53_003600 [Coemansia erecta]|uniref:Arb2 domain-containing protein n=1 Tax=Coemansia erecta TaxID=147472 RepID=A0A9W7Y0Z5_9FUNG|nr:hypothetical protein LPJ53_003600 [Coemansia erecta]
MFVRPKKPVAEVPVRVSLKELGFRFDIRDGLLREIGTQKPYKHEYFGNDKTKNAALYDKLIQTAPRKVALLLESDKDLCMEPIAVPDLNQPHCNIYATPGALSKDCLVVIVNGNGNFCGVWGWNILVKRGLRPGSVIEYARECVKRGFGVLVLNPNENVCGPDGITDTFNTCSRYVTSIEGSETPEDHVGYVWSRIIRESKAEKVVFVAYNTAGIAVTDLLRYDFDRFTKKTVGIAYIDSAHAVFQLGPEHLAWLSMAAKQWESSNEPDGMAILNSRAGCPTVSVSNTTGHREMAPSICMNSVLAYAEQCFERGATIIDTSELSLDESIDDSTLSAIQNIQIVEPLAPDQPSDGYIGWE